jgi:hypothetical protein
MSSKHADALQDPAAPQIAAETYMSGLASLGNGDSANGVKING